MAKVLIVDDERSIRETLSEFIREMGHEVFSAGDVAEALEIVSRSLPDVVVCDIVLPGGGGIVLLDRVRRIESDTQVIMITGEPTVETAADAVRQGAFDYLAKPVSRDEIQAVVESALRVKRISDERSRLAEENLRYRDHLEEVIEEKARALLASERDYRNLVENANEAVFIAQEGRLTFANPKTVEVTGYPLDRLLSMPFSELTHPDDRELVAGRHRARLEGEDVPAEYEFRIVDASGEVRWIEIRPVLIEWEGKPATLNLASDITDRRAAEKAREESETRYRTLFENSPISLWQEDYSVTKALLDEIQAGDVGDLESHLLAHPELIDQCIQSIRVVDINEASVSLHAAASKDDLLGRLDVVIPPESRPGFVTQLLAIASGATSYEGVGTDRRLDGSVMQASIRWVVASGFEKTFSLVLVSKIDITAAVEAEAALQAALEGTIAAIGLTTEMRDPYTAGHQKRSTELAVAIAADLGLDKSVAAGVRAAGLMHDIGKLAVPAEILSKPSALSDVEMSLIKAHPSVAYDILKTVAFPWPVADIVVQHHERMDGTGYPAGLSGEAIRIEAQILCVADVVEAMASHRPYRPALGIDAALAEIAEHRGTRYQADVVDACIRLFRERGFAFTEDTDHGSI